MKKLFLFAFATTILLCVQAQTTSTVQDYINTYKELAISEEIRSGIPAAITLAQGIIESEAGQSDLVKQSNNHFGIKCKGEWTGNKIYHDDDAKGECFRVYSSAEESFKDHSDFLKLRPYYVSLFSIDPTDYEAWAKGLKKCGYATNPKYAEMLIKTINDYHLQDYTLIALQRQSGQNDNYALNNRPSDYSSISAANTAEEQSAVNRKETVAKVAQTTITAPSYPTGVFEINQTKVTYAPAGTSLFALASNYHLEFGKLLEYNELTNKDILDKDQLIFLAKKPKKGSKEFHVVNANETLEYISQTEGVRLENLLEYNHLQKGAQPAQGEKIYLQASSPSKPKLATSNSVALTTSK